MHIVPDVLRIRPTAIRGLHLPLKAVVTSLELEGLILVQAAHGSSTCVCISRCCQLRSADPTISSIQRMESILTRYLMQSCRDYHARAMLGKLTHMQETKSRDMQLWREWLDYQARYDHADAWRQGWLHRAAVEGCTVSGSRPQRVACRCSHAACHTWPHLSADPLKSCRNSPAVAQPCYAPHALSSVQARP